MVYKTVKRKENKMKSVLCAVLALIINGCGSNTKETELVNRPEGKILVVYYSQSGVQNTQTVAQWISEAVGGDIQEIEMVEPYTGSYREVVKRSREDFENNVRPIIKPFEKGLAEYDILFIGAPIWFGTYAPPAATFLAAHDFTGKIVIPFCTHGGGGAGNLYDDIRKNTEGASVVESGFTARGSNQIERRIGRGVKSRVSKNDVILWLNEVFGAGMGHEEVIINRDISDI